jgi:hypothetical protein
MAVFLNLAWMFVGVLKFGGLAVALSGVAVFGWYFVRGNAQAARDNADKVPSSSWRGPGPIFGAKILGTGIALQVMSALLAAALPGRL